MIYAPILDSSIPAFGDTLVIPFSLNPSVAPSEVQGFAFQIKTMTGALVDRGFKAKGIDEIENRKAVFTDIQNLVIGQYYKIQLAFLSEVPQDLDY